LLTKKREAKMKAKLEEQLKKHQEDLGTVEKQIQNNLLLKERLIGAVATIQEMLEPLDDKKKKK
jgi:hypothetical protein|tara:strand:+ start:1091 stop:1282 length:192 start_codon:yes stop_codon:yes gene_type:complete